VNSEFIQLRIEMKFSTDLLWHIRVYESYGRDKGGYDYRMQKEMARITDGFVEQGYKAVKACMQIRRNGALEVPNEPGLGLIVNENAMEAQRK
jgi:hypothetical protein